MAVDLDRGVVMRNHRQGFKVCMYADQPGVYYTISGKEVPEAVAAEAGFNVSKLSMERSRREKLSQLQQQVDEEFGALAEGAAVFEAGGYAVVHNGDGGFGIKDPDGNMLTDKSLPRDQAVTLAKQLANEESTPATETQGEE